MARPEDDHPLWDGKVVVTDTRQTRHGHQTHEERDWLAAVFADMQQLWRFLLERGGTNWR